MTTLEIVAVAGFGLTLLGAIARVIVVVASHKVDPDPHPGRYVDWPTHQACMRDRNEAARETARELGTMNEHLSAIRTVLKDKLP